MSSCLYEAVCADAGGYELVVIEVALIDHPHICQAKQQYTSDGKFFAQLATGVGHQQQATYDDDQCTAPYISSHQCLTHFSEIGHDAAKHLFRNAALL